ncbi:MAG: glutamate-5-semialdehyde dehydrogenase [Candidatus Omnitrophica bacterium CG1_02_44_16]|nr:MAG: glutamate-5-semialdehyde dehydrogenase [Candidatus Omnitrophica bacterium CG1_02_44_16]PIZ83218.1 MAG: glutamate-5-semialdehyde dehydrogenase [Candidatus Omnitrophica bacterium CG_4_10_14_0_2_um_filter_44_9]
MKKADKDPLFKKLNKMASEAKEALRALVNLSSDKKNEVLELMAQALIDKKGSIINANKKDLKNAQGKKLSPAFIERLTLSEKHLNDMARSLLEISKLQDPVGNDIKAWSRPNGLLISKVRVPIGVILIIYESRPNVTSDCIGLMIKSGNAVILRGGKEALFSNVAIYEVLKKVILGAGLPRGVVTFIDLTDRKAVDILLSFNQYIDLVMPRGGESLIRQVRDKSKIPVIKHYKGICHVFVDRAADFAMAQRIILNAKVQRPGVCNAIETLLVHESVARDFLPTMIEALQDARVEIRACEKTRKIVKGVKKATDKDWSTEYLGLILSVRVVRDVDEAIAHINYYGSRHSDTIVTQDEGTAEKFLKQVDSACVYVNASTRFTDGYQFGFGAEIGISTDKLHARGPMGLEELTTYKYVIRGNGQIRE